MMMMMRRARAREFLLFTWGTRLDWFVKTIGKVSSLVEHQQHQHGVLLLYREARYIKINLHTMKNITEFF